MRILNVYVDGASKGNPGPSGIGIIICRDGETIKNISRYIGNATNNVAEYMALICGLEECLAMKAENINVNTDSQLMHRQIIKEYKVKNTNILELYNQATRLMSGFKKVSVNYIGRENNKGADKLATLAVKDELRKSRSLIGVR